MTKANRTNVMNEDWDHLIVLDACRYDYFEKVWQKYLPGKLRKKLSVGSTTVEWRDKTFTDYYGDVVYISSNPYISLYMTCGMRAGMMKRVPCSRKR